MEQGRSVGKDRHKRLVAICISNLFQQEHHKRPSPYHPFASKTAFSFSVLLNDRLPLVHLAWNMRSILVSYWFLEPSRS